MTKIEEIERDQVTKSARKDIIPELTDKQYSSLTRMALRAGLHNARELIQSFVADLTGWQGNGSDEEYFASLWYERTYAVTLDSFMPWRYHVYNYDYDVQELSENPEVLEEAYRQYGEECRCHGVDPESWEEILKVNQELLQEQEADLEVLEQKRHIMNIGSIKNEPNR
ncbi:MULTISPECIES: hypothetical protein [Blautia]|uniref:hypothetical protein n=1 Tax=Blautia TaxID=572511 RepID=UPI001D06B733|nr:hypothetical protein [Blautia producta]MCB6726754.1 hypothetical protein [Blautia marasmi]MCQ4868999.1 hypothetical protein [Blautia producta]MCQ5095576.1 hypothetical protein [Blautia producta]